MIIENIRREIFEGKGNSQEKLKRIYGKELNPTNARKYLAGIRLHLETMKGIGEDYLPSDLMVDEGSKEVSFNPDKTQTIRQDIYLAPGEDNDPARIMAVMGFDPLLWEVKSCKVVSGKWDVTIKNKEFEGVKHTNRKYSVTLTVEPLGGELTFPQVLSAFRELDPVKVMEYDYDPIVSGKGYLFELPIMDFHLGKLAWTGETGDDDYDLKLAEKLWRKTVNDLIDKAVNFGDIEKVLFPIGQDFFHFDTPGVTTTAGTQLDSDTRWQKMFRKGVELLVWAVEELRKIAPVEVLWIPGNHDTMLGYAATVGLAQRYFGTDSVKVDLSAKPRKYRLWGVNLIGYSHGEKEGKRLEGLMQIEAAEMWGKCLFREFHMGHLHTESTITKNGIVFRRISAITAPDAWHVEGGFIGSTRQAQAFLWDKVNGLQVILNSNVKSKIMPNHNN